MMASATSESLRGSTSSPVVYMYHGVGDAPDSAADNRLAERICLKKHYSERLMLGWQDENVAPTVAVKLVVAGQRAQERDGVGDI